MAPPPGLWSDPGVARHKQVLVTLNLLLIVPYKLVRLKYDIRMKIEHLLVLVRPIVQKIQYLDKKKDSLTWSNKHL